jgi:isochorismate synthase EntC
MLSQLATGEQAQGARNPTQPTPRPTGQTDWPLTPSTKFQQTFQTIKSLIADNQINKAVLTTLVPIALASEASVSVVVEPSKITSSYDANPWLSALPQLLTATLNNAGPTRYPYALWTPHEGIIGATPEILFDLNAPTSTLKTMALAGTRKASLENSAPLLFDPKERHEHKLVLDFLLQQLRQLSDIGTVSCSETYVLRTGELCHLRADVEVSTAPGRKSCADEAGWAEHTKFIKRLVELLHPTPALGTAPHKAFSLLKSLDNGKPRGRFGAPFGILTTDGSFRTLVAIRNLQWGSFKNTSESREPGVSAFIGVGCGIVENSRLEDEWRELILKLQSICNLFNGES